jgi:hypothetical protein
MEIGTAAAGVPRLARGRPREARLPHLGWRPALRRGPPAQPHCAGGVRTQRPRHIGANRCHPSIMSSKASP